MPGQPPKPPVLDDRTLSKIMLQLLTEARKQFDGEPGIPSWRPIPGELDEIAIQQLFATPFGDAGLMITLLFSRMLEITLERLNQVPEKNLFAFLDAMGVSLLLPSAAAAPLTFAGTGRLPSPVPEGTQAATKPGGSHPATYETEQALTVVPARIVQSFTLDPRWDRLTEQTARLNGPTPGAPAGFTPFVGEQRMPHILYLGEDSLLNFRRSTTVGLKQRDGNALHPMTEDWKTFLDSLSWQCLLSSADDAKSPPAIGAWDCRSDGGWTPLEMKDGKIDFPDSAPIAQKTLQGAGLESGITSRWLRAMLPMPLPDAPLPKDAASSLVPLSNLVLSVEAKGLLPDAAFANNATLDVTRVFLPFGDLPKTGDVFIFGSAEVFGAAGAKVTLNFTLAKTRADAAMEKAANERSAAEAAKSARQQEAGDDTNNTEKQTAAANAVEAASNARDMAEKAAAGAEAARLRPGPTLAWEYLAESGWSPLTITSGPDKAQAILAKWNKSDSTDANNPTGEVQFTVPHKPVKRTINGQQGYWIRARIANGDYGTPPTYQLADIKDPKSGYIQAPNTGDLDPPRILALTLNYEAESSPKIVTQNGFLLKVQSDQDRRNGFAPFIPISELTPSQYADRDPAFYLGFDAAFPQETVTLYVAVAARAAGASVVREMPVAQASSSYLPPIEWEYFNGALWKMLTVIDRTNHLTVPGTVEFLTPTDIQRMARFDLTPLYWIRSRVSSNDPVETRRLAGLYLNTVPAIQAVWVDDELLGSASGLPGQTLTFSRSPVLAAPEVLVREKERPSAEEAASLEQEQGGEAIFSRFNAVTGEPEFWVRWCEVQSFILSGPSSRHYTLDHMTGVLRFGDGRRGLVPLRDTNNIMVTYQTGGGAAGNVAADSIVQISSTLPGIASVTNPLPATGGADAEKMAQLRLRGPQTLKHREHALSAEDMEWLAREAAGMAVARVKSLPNVNGDLRFEPGWITLIVTPRGDETRPTPGADLIRRIEEFLAERAAPGLAAQTPRRINVMGPGYIEVAVHADIVPDDPHQTQALRESVRTALAEFFHPLRGGRDRQGWEFGRNVFASEVSQLLQRVPGVNHVKTLALRASVAQNRFTMNPLCSLSVPLAVGSSIRTPDLTRAALAAEPVPAGVATAQLLCKGFKEGDRVTVAQDFRVRKETTQAAGGSAEDKMTLRPITGASVPLPAFGFPRGSLIASFDGARRTRLAAGAISRVDARDNEIYLELKTDEAVFDAGDIVTVFYPFPITVRAVHKPVVTLTVINVDENTQTVKVAPFDTDATGLPAGSRVQKAEPLFESARRSWLAAAPNSTPPGMAVGPNLTRQDTIMLRQENESSDETKKLSPALKPGDILNVHVPVLTLSIDPYEAEGPRAISGAHTAGMPALPKGCVITTLDNRVRLPLAADVPAWHSVNTLHLSDFADGDTVFPGESALEALSKSVSPVGDLPIKKVLPLEDTIYLDDNYLVCTGDHVITMSSD